jgi:hypothetical protein
MNGQREMPGYLDQTGKRINTLRVERITSRTPLRYSVRCEVCGTQTTEPHQRLTSGSATCRNSNCGKPATKRDLLTEQRQQIADREAERLADEQAASVARMEAEVEGYERPKGILQTKLLHERQKIEEQGRLEAERKAAEKREAAEAAKRERQETQREYWAEAIQSGPDPRLYVTPELSTAEMPTKEAAARNEAEANKFVQTTPEFAEYKSPANADKIFAYLETNGVFIFDVETLRAAFVRLRDLGILVKNPTPVKQPPDQPKVNLTVASAIELSKPLYSGWDEGGNERQYSQREISRMSSEEMKRRLRLYPDKLTLPNTGPGPLGSR